MAEARIDKWLWATRIFKTRTIAAEACKKGRVMIGGSQVKAARMIKPGDVIQVKKPPITYSFKVVQPIEKRVGAKLVSEYMENVTTPDANDKAVYGLRQITAKYNHAKDQLEYTRLYAPFSGYVQKRLFDSHETVAAGMPVVSVISEGTPEVEINLPAVEYIRRRQFTRYYCTFDVYPQQRYVLDLISVTPKANANQLYTMRLQLKSGDKQAVPSPGMNTMVTIECAEGEMRNLSVPGGAILRQNGNTGVFLYNPSDKTIRRCDVTVTRLLSDGRCLIVSDEVKPGDLIVVSGVHHVKDGQQVEPLLPAAETNVGGLL